MSNIKKIIMAAVILSLSMTTGYYIKDYMNYVSTDNAQIAAHYVLLASKVPGFITKVKVKEGDFVKAGSILIEIDSRDYRNSLKQYEADLSAIGASKNDAEKNLKRVSDLYKKDVTSQQSFDQSKTLVLQLRAKYESVSAMVDQAKLNLENTKIIAPSDGFVAKTSAEPGQLTGSGTPLIGFVDSGERWVIANFKETEIPHIKIGAKVKIEIDAIPGKSFAGGVESMSSATGATCTLLPPDNATGNFTKVVQRIPVRIKFINPDSAIMEKLRNGLSAVVKVSRS
jgi:membrane fusion protein (multidrug efflux system)